MEIKFDTDSKQKKNIIEGLGDDEKKNVLEIISRKILSPKRKRLKKKTV